MQSIRCCLSLLQEQIYGGITIDLEKLKEKYAQYLTKSAEDTTSALLPKWDRWYTYIYEQNKTLWRADLRITNSTNGEKTLYDITPIKMVERSGNEDTNTTVHSIYQSEQKSQGNSQKNIEKQNSISREQRSRIGILFQP